MSNFEVNKKIIIQLIKDIRNLLYPGYFCDHQNESELKDKIYNTLLEQLDKVNKLSKESLNVKKIAQKMIDEMDNLAYTLQTDLEATFKGDPAAHDTHEIIVSYPGFFATLVHRIAHLLYNENVIYIPRIMSEYAHYKTGIDIHPGAKIGPYFFIDHGTGIVIGETSVIESNVKIYQNVTIGALSLGRGQELKGLKRHPTIKKNTTIYSGATILGGDTVIGENVTIGANVFLTNSVDDNNIVILKASDLEYINKK